ncbi:MAG: folylpolyglutamate synthase/dihydrofolate synthase family protein [Candidatus Omnitrophota bacterium]
MKKYKDALLYLDTFINYEKKGFKRGADLDLGRVRAALRKLSRPERRYVSVHVAGTKGKGSVSAFTASILQRSGMKTGLYTSPHLSTTRERIRFNGRMIGKRDFAEAVFFLKKKLGNDANSKLTYFEIMTLLAMSYFAFKKSDIAIFETGMGGRLDATNVIKPVVCCITPISYDHTSVLGRSLEKIAKEKAAIIKRGSVCVSSQQKAGALKVIEERCLQVNSRLILAGRQVNSVVKDFGPRGTLFDIITPSGRYRNLKTKMPGKFQTENAAAAVAICEEVRKRTDRAELTESDVRRAVGKAFIAARMEVLASAPFIVIDGAQNAASAEKISNAVRETFNYDKLVLITAFCGDKDIKGSCRAFAEIADAVIVTRARTPRSANPVKIASCFSRGKVIIAESPGEALRRAKEISGKKDLILAAGSLYLAGEIREIVKGRTSL